MILNLLYMSQHPPLRLCSSDYLEKSSKSLLMLSQICVILCLKLRELYPYLKLKNLSSPVTNTSTNTNTDNYTLKPLLFPYHQDISALNPVIREAGYRFIFTSRNTIGKNVISKYGLMQRPPTRYQVYT